jgi:hypothetical protein
MPNDVAVPTGPIPQAFRGPDQSAPAKKIATWEIVLGLLLSPALLIPCFWHRHIQAGDLASHVYNAWLAQLVREGKAPGVYTVWLWKNVLFDWMLLFLSRAFGFAVAEKIAVSTCVLVFFWGVFALASIEAHQRPWFLFPGLAMLAYGYVFHMGFMNYYLSIGLGCFGLAALWNGRPRGILLATLLAPLALLAHPLGFFWLLAVGVYRLLWPRMRGWSEWLPPVGALVTGLLIHWALVSHPQWELDWPQPPFFLWNGADQVWIFRPETANLRLALAIFVVAASLLDLLNHKKASATWKERRLFLEFYLVAFSLTSLLPENLRPDPNAGWIGMLVSRLTLLSAIFAFCWLATLRPRVWHVAVLGACAAFFFTFVYRDTARFERLEENAEKIARELPCGTRVLATIHEPTDFRDLTLHVVDRACVGHCFLYSNYEPATRQFRLRVQEDSPVAVATTEDSEDMQSGNYEVREDDLPLKQIYQCDAGDLTKLCVRDLQAGEKNGRTGYHPQ